MYLVSLLADTNYCAIHAKRVTVQPKDICWKCGGCNWCERRVFKRTVLMYAAFEHWRGVKEGLVESLSTWCYVHVLIP
jgi:hypothetical protein